MKKPVDPKYTKEPAKADLVAARDAVMTAWKVVKDMDGLIFAHTRNGLLLLREKLVLADPQLGQIAAKPQRGDAPKEDRGQIDIPSGGEYRVPGKAPEPEPKPVPRKPRGKW